MRLLILGHTAFLGRALVEQALQRQHDLTVVGRTRVDRERHQQVEWIDADPEDALFRVGVRTYDAVIDLSPRLSDTTLRSALSLADRTNLYLLVTSTSVYRDFVPVAAQPGSPAPATLDESHPTARHPDGVDENPADFATYGARLARCEQRVAEAVPDRTLIVRPGLLTGPYDCTQRIPRLLSRIRHASGDVLAGGSPDQPVQVLDVRDLAGFLLDRAAAGVPGLLNAVGDTISLGSFMSTAAAALDARCDFVYPGDAFLARHGFEPLSQLPLWVPARGFPAFFRVANTRAKRLGLRPRPLADTLAAAHAWHAPDAQSSDAADLQLPAGGLPTLQTLPLAAERRLLAECRDESRDAAAAPELAVA